MSRFAHEHPDDPEGAMERLIDRADAAKTEAREAGSLTDEIFATVRSATAALYPEARIPETAMPNEAELGQRLAELARQINVARRNIRMVLNILDHPMNDIGDRAEIKERLQRILRETD